MKIIIDIKDGVPETTAVFLVLSVMRKGRISFAKDGTPHFCWASVSPNGFIVHTRQKSSPNAADSFVVMKDVGGTALALSDAPGKAVTT